MNFHGGDVMVETFQKVATILWFVSAQHIEERIYIYIYIYIELNEVSMGMASEKEWDMGPYINLTVEDSREKMNWKNIKLVIT